VVAWRQPPSAATSIAAHSVAADQNSHFVVVSIGLMPSTSPAETDPTNPCPTNGHIVVYRARSEGSDDKISQ
jgi:hypothetical protein